MYIRKTEDIYFIIWNGEEIDTADNYPEAKMLLNEYKKAFNNLGAYHIKKKRVRICY